MSNDELVSYIRLLTAKNIPANQIVETLNSQGWTPPEIESALAEASSKTKESSKFSVAKVFLYLGGIITIVAGLTYIGINWSAWGSLLRIFAVVLPMAVCYGIGTTLLGKENLRTQGVAFIVVASFLFPVVLSVAFKELALFKEPFDLNFNFTVTAASLVIYLLTDSLIKHPIFSLLYQGAGIFAYYMFLRLCGMPGYIEGPAAAWLLLVPACFYLFWSVVRHLNGHLDRARYSFTLGIITSGFSLFRIFAETYTHPDIVWILLLSGIAYFLFASWLEKKGIKDFASTGYMIGAVIIFMSVSTASSRVMFLIRGSKDTVDYGDMMGWPNILNGFFYFSFTYGISRLVKAGNELSRKYGQFFNTLAPLYFLSGVAILGTGGSKPVYETLLLVSSLGFIFGSIPKHVKSYLYLGTIFLIGYIFGIGGEYFQNQVGWPITLFVTGILAMGIGVGMDSMRKKYFGKEISNAKSS